MTDDKTRQTLLAAEDRAWNRLKRAREELAEAEREHDRAIAATDQYRRNAKQMVPR